MISRNFYTFFYFLYSGGQKRRVSFAVALLHNPELLILDEPTVGVDPMLRQNIWNHLLRLCQEQKKTILITTHYIEEARYANTRDFSSFSGWENSVFLIICSSKMVKCQSNMQISKFTH